MLLTETAHAAKKNAAKKPEAAPQDSKAAANNTKATSKSGQTAPRAKNSAGDQKTPTPDAGAEGHKTSEAVSDPGNEPKDMTDKTAAGTDDARNPDDKTSDKAAASDKPDAGAVTMADGLAPQVATANPQMPTAQAAAADPDTAGANASKQVGAINGPAAKDSGATALSGPAPDVKLAAATPAGKPPEISSSAGPAAEVPGKTADASTKPEARADKSGPDAAPPQPPQTAASQTPAPQMPAGQASLAQTPPPITQHVTVADSAPAGATQAAAGLIRPDLPGLAVSIAARSLSGARQFDIRLDPPELGHVEVRLSIDAAGKTSAHLSADHPQTLDLLQKDAGSLTRALRDAGLDVSQNSLNFSLRQQGGHSAGDSGSRSASRGRARNLTVSRTLEPLSGVSVSYRAPLDGRLDIQV
jgi:chemotaxis protein MotD